MLHAGPMDPVLRTSEPGGPEPFKSEHGDDMDFKLGNALHEYCTNFALHALLERHNIVRLPSDEREIRSLFVDTYQQLRDEERRQRLQLQAAAAAPVNAADVYLLQVMRQIFERHPDWLDRRNNNQPPAAAMQQQHAPAAAAVADDETSSVASSASSSLSNPPSSCGTAAPTTRGQRHSSGRPFKCAVCGKEFGYKHVLQNHERTHTGEKPFVCSVCKKCFTRDHHLKTHVRLHTGEKPFWCPHCNRFFVQVANLRRHLKTHTGETSHPCEYCVAFFETAAELKDHKRQHKENNKPRGGAQSGAAKPAAQKRRRAAAGNKDVVVVAAELQTAAELVQLQHTTPWSPVAHGSPPPSPRPSVPSSYWSSPPPQPQTAYVVQKRPAAVSPPTAVAAEPYHHYLRFIARFQSPERNEAVLRGGEFQSPVQTEPEDLSVRPKSNPRDQLKKPVSRLTRTAEQPVDLAMDLTCK